MGAIIPESQENEIIKFLRKDDANSLQELIQINRLPSDLLYTKKKRTLLQLSCYYESPKCLSKLIELNYDYNLKENITGDTPLFICCKFNNLEMVRILLEKEDCKKLVRNYGGLNEFDIAFLKGNYNICYFLMYVYKNDSNDIENDNNNGKNENINNINNEKNNINNENMNEISTKEIVIRKKSKENKENKEGKNNSYNINQIYQKYFYNTDFEYDYFLTLQAENKYPLFNMPLFFRCLCNKTLPSNCPSFAPEHKKTLDLTTKIPDPNETWGHFFKRVVTMDLYNPPLVDKKKVSEMNSIYMNTQMKLLENEYGIKMGYYQRNKEEEEATGNEYTTHPLDKDDSEILQIKNKEKTKILNLKINKQSESKNENNGKEENDIKLEDVNNNEIYMDNNINNDNKMDNDDINNDGNLCMVKINNNTSERELKNDNQNENE